MKRVLGICLIVVSFFFLAGCDDLFTDQVEKTSITSHKLNWDDGKPSKIEVWWDWADNTDEHILERKAPDDNLEFFELIWSDELLYYQDTGYDLPDHKSLPDTSTYTAYAATLQMNTVRGPMSILCRSHHFSRRKT